MDATLRQEIRELYQQELPTILRTYPLYDRAIFLELVQMNQVERNVWTDIRYAGLPFFPQFPVKHYFLDFGDPVKKIAIEVDGAAWHQDVAKDAARQEEIEREGWRFYRIAARDTFIKLGTNKYGEEVEINPCLKWLREIQKEHYLPLDEDQIMRNKYF